MQRKPRRPHGLLFESAHTTIVELHSQTGKNYLLCTVQVAARQLLYNCEKSTHTHTHKRTSESPPSGAAVGGRRALDEQGDQPGQAANCCSTVLYRQYGECSASSRPPRSSSKTSTHQEVCKRALSLEAGPDNVKGLRYIGRRAFQ